MVCGVPRLRFRAALWCAWAAKDMDGWRVTDMAIRRVGLVCFEAG